LFHRYEDFAILDTVTAQFAARLKTNAFKTIVTAWILTITGREWFRAEEQHFLAQFQDQLCET
jgi:hypothetical protein